MIMAHMTDNFKTCFNLITLNIRLPQKNANYIYEYLYKKVCRCK